MENQPQESTSTTQKTGAAAAEPTNFREQYCETHVITVSPEATLTEAAKLMRENHIGDVVVCDAEGVPLGILTDRDIVIGTLGQTAPTEGLVVQDIMTRNVATARDTASVEEIVTIMRQEGVGRLPLVNEHGILCGIVTAKKVIQWLSHQLDGLVNAAEKQQSKEQELKH